MSEPEPVTINLDKVALIARRSVNRANLFLGIALSGYAHREHLDHRTVERFRIEVVSRDLTDLEKEHVFREWRNWTINCAIRDMIDAFSIFETRIYEIYLAIEAGGVAKKSEIGPASRQFDRHSVAEKWTRLASFLGLPTEYAAYFESFRAIRNCLSHRLGIVGIEDCKGAPPRLTLTWSAPQIVAVAPGFEDIVVAAADFQGPIKLDPPRQIGIRQTPRVRELVPGQAIVLSAADVFEICSTFGSGIDMLWNAIASRARAGGLFVDPPAAAREG